MHVGRPSLSLLLAACLSLPPAAASAASRKKEGEPVRVPTAAQCAPLPAAGAPPWEPGERLAYDVDVMGAGAGKIALVALPPVGSGRSKEYPLRALAASNSFVSQVKRFRGRSTSYVRSRDLHPRRYREDSNEDGLIRSADVVFARSEQGPRVTIDWTRAKQKGKRIQRYANDAFDPVAAAYYFRAIDLAPGQALCFDAYGLRYMWRVYGTVKGVETVTVPAGTFQAYHFAGTAVRIDNPRRHRELHVWIGTDGKRLPLAGMMTMDVGPVRAQLTSVGEASASESEDTLLATKNGAAAKPTEGAAKAADPGAAKAAEKGAGAAKTKAPAEKDAQAKE